MKALILTALYYFRRLLFLAILVYCILSWFAASNPKVLKFYRFLGGYLEPLFRPAKFILYKLNLRIPVDFSPWLTMILIDLVYNILFNILR